MSDLTRRAAGLRRFEGSAGPRTSVCPGPAEPVRTERRVVTVLFVDIVGSTAIAADLAPEELFALQTEYFRTVARVLHRWNGVVEKYIGDAVMAIFGLSRTDLDHAYRAVRAGTEILDRVGGHRFPAAIRLQVRVGVATGVVVVDPAAARDGGHGFVSGVVVNTAARVQSHAAAGTVAVTAATRTACGSRISYRRLGPVCAAGIRGPLRLWQPAGIDAQPPLRSTGREPRLTPAIAGRRVGQPSPTVEHRRDPVGESRPGVNRRRRGRQRE
nr:adenylate/guanylate cyclase domain-containing protein [Micromonospora sp. DSM 115978]